MKKMKREILAWMLLVVVLFANMPMEVLAIDTLGSPIRTMGTVHTNVSNTAVSTNATNGSLPSNAATPLAYGKQYYFNMQVTSDVNVKTGVLYILKNGASYDSKSYTASNYCRYIAQPYIFYDTGSFSAYWVITDTSGNVTTTGKISFSVTYQVSLSFSSSSMSFTYGDASKVNTVRVSGEGCSSISYGCNTNSYISLSWGSWNSGNVPLTITPKAAGTTIVTIYAKNSSGTVISSKSFTVTVNKKAASLSFASNSLTKSYGSSSFTNSLTKVTDGTVSYSSSNTSVATVDSSTGLVSLKGVGSCTITAKALAGSNYNAALVSYTLTVTKASAVFSFESTSVSKTYGDASFVNPLTTNTTGTITYSSSNTSVATINSSTGRVTIQGAGSCTITATAASNTNYASGSKSYSLTVNRGTPQMRFANSYVYADYGETPSYNTLTTNADGKITYSSSDTSVATVDSNGYVIGVGVGTCRITATAATGNKYKSAAASYSLTISRVAPVLQFDSDSVSKTYGDKNFTNPLTTNADGQITYSSSNNAVASVNSRTGMVTIAGAGKCVITATASEGTNCKAGSQSYTLVVDRAQSLLTFEKSDVYVVYGDSVRTNSLEIHTDGQITYETSNTSVAEVDSNTGAITVHAAGSCTITAKSVKTDKYEAAQASYKLTVYQADVQFFFESTSVTKTYGDDNFINPLNTNADTEDIYYESSNTAVAKVDSKTGRVTITGTGDCYITATATAGAHYAGGSKSYLLTVNKAAPKMEFAENNLSVVYGETFAENTLVTNTDGTVMYTSSDTSIAVVNKNTGLITLKGPGSCSITATAAASRNYFAESASYTLTVTQLCTISYDANGGMNAPEAIRNISVFDTVQISQFVPKREDFTFLGWAKDANAKEAAYQPEDMIYVTGNVTLYAVWQEDKKQEEPEKDSALTWENLHYSFGNTANAFGYPANYSIPLSSYQMIFGNTTKAKLYYTEAKLKPWNGNCMGMSSTAILFHQTGTGVKVQDFKSSANQVSDLQVGDSSSQMSLTAFIEALQIAQKTELVRSSIANSRVYNENIQSGSKNLNQIYQRLEEAKEANKAVVLGIYRSGYGGHALLAYDLEKISDTESKVLIYDCNYPTKQCYMNLKCSSTGEWTEWSYDMGDYYGIWGTESEGSSISCITYDVIENIWKTRGNLEEDMNIMHIQSDNAAIYNSDNQIVVKIEEGNATVFDNQIYVADDSLTLRQKEEVNTGVDLILPIDIYTIVSDSAELEKFSVSLMDVQLAASVTTTASNVTLAVDDSCNLNAVYISASEDDTYSVTLNSSYEEDNDDVVIEGKGLNDVLDISQIKGNISINNCQILSMSIEGKKLGSSTITAFASEGGTISPLGETIVMNGNSQTYTITPNKGYCIEDVLIDGERIQDNNDYKANYVVNGKSASYTFKDISKNHTISAAFVRAGKVTSAALKTTSYVYDGKAKTPAVTVKDENGITLTKNRDYTVRYANNVKVGTATVTIQGIGNFKGTLKKTFTIKKVSQKISVPKTSYSVVYGVKAFSLKAKNQSSGGAKLKYDSSNTKVASVSSAGKITIKGCGTAAITIRAAAVSNKYSAASKTIKITVKPKKIAFSSVRNDKAGRITLKWKGTRCSKYEIQYSLKKNFKSGVKTITVKSGITSKAITKLKKKKTYYVRIRTVASTGKSAWSAVKSIKVNK